VLGEAPLAPGEFAWLPQMSTGGPMLVLVNIKAADGLRVPQRPAHRPHQREHRQEGPRDADRRVHHPAEEQDHHSNIYNNAPMPYMQRLTWDGVALHAGNIPGYPASHGCVRLPYEFSKLLFEATTMGVTVVIANDAPAPSMVAGNLIKPEAKLSSQVEQAWAGAYTGSRTVADRPAHHRDEHAGKGRARPARRPEIGRVHVEVKDATRPAPPPTCCSTAPPARRARSCRASPRCAGRSIGDGEQEDAVTSAAESFAAGIAVPPGFAERSIRC
jgi:hypothetical protein